MRNQRLTLTTLTTFLTVVGAIVVLATVSTAAQGTTYTPPSTVDGQPDLQGVWGYATITPMERPRELSGKQVFSDQEAAEFEETTLRNRDNDRRDDDPTRTRPQVNGG